MAHAPVRLTVHAAFIALAAAFARAEDPGRFVYSQKGELPIILSAPHGGTMAVPDVSVRKGEGLPTGGRGFVASRDTGTEELAKQVADSIARRFGKKPYVVIARSHRKYLDPNRPADIAYEDPDAKPVYDEYHAALDGYCREVQAKFHTGLLLDLHGQGSASDTVFRGTQNGATVGLLRERYGKAAYDGEVSLFGKLKSLGWTVHPTPLDGREQPDYAGGYIVRTYGTARYGIDAIQLEFGRDYRADDARGKTAATLTEAVADYAAKYLQVAALPGQSGVPTSKTGQRIKVGVYIGDGASESRKTLVDVLAKDPGVEVVDLTPDDIRGGKLAECNVLIQPGGSGGGQGKALGEEGRQMVREFVQAGGGYVGVCAGAYLATCDYDWSLNILDAKVLDRKHWNRGFGTVEIGLTDRGKEMFKTPHDRLSIYYHQGPLLAPADNPEIPDYEGLARFETEIAKNGAPTGVMPGCTAIALAKFQNGRVLCFSPHPERTEGLEQLLLEAVAWAANGSVGGATTDK